MSPRPRIGVIGTGLIGASLGMAFRRTGTASEVLGFDLDPARAAAAAEAGALDAAADVDEVACSSDYLFLAVPVVAMPGVMKRIAGRTKPGAVITDVGSVKAPVMAAAREILHPGQTFVGGHPMAGTERGGLKDADPYLFENAAYVLTPPTPSRVEEGDSPGELDRREHPGLTASADVNRLSQVVSEGTGASVVIMSADEHDALVGLVSHLPYVTAVALSLVADSSGGDRALALAAGGFRDATRVAQSDPELWTGICLSNREALLQHLSSLCGALEAIASAVRSGVPAQLRDILERARDVRRRLPTASKGLAGPLWDVVVTVPDRPGSIAECADALGRAGINIKDIEILRVREGEGGTLRLGLGSEDEARRAVRVLAARSLPARLR